MLLVILMNMASYILNLIQRFQMIIKGTVLYLDQVEFFLADHIFKLPLLQTFFFYISMIDVVKNSMW